MTPCPKPRVVKKARQPLRAKKRLRGRSKRSQKSGGHLFPKNVDEARREWIRSQPCHVTKQSSGEWYLGVWLKGAPIPAGPRYIRVVVAHVKSRGSGAVDAGNMIPLDATLHDEQGLIGWAAFWKKYGLDKSPREVAADYEARYQAGATPTQEKR